LDFNRPSSTVVKPEELVDVRSDIGV